MKTSQPVLEKLTDRIPVDSVYEFHYPFLEESKPRLLVVIDSKCQVSTKTLEPMAELCFAAPPSHSFELIPYGELKNAINNGSLYYVLACRKKQQQLALGKKPLPILALKELENIRAKTLEHYEKGNAKQSDFLEGMEFYREKGNFSQALFMLHQATELTFRAVENGIFKRDRPSHSLEEHFRLISRYIPELAGVFDKDDPYHYRLLKLIDQSYTAVRYQRHFEVEADELDGLYTKLQPILNWCGAYSVVCMEALDLLIASAIHQAPPVQVPSNPAEEKSQGVHLPKDLVAHISAEQHESLLQSLTQLIKNQSLQQVLLFGYERRRSRVLSLYEEASEERAVHCYLLAVTKGGSTIKSHSEVQQNMRLTLLFASEQQLALALEKRSPFYTQVLNNGYRVYASAAAKCMPLITAVDWEKHRSKAQTVWSYRKEKAETFLRCAELALTQRQDALIASFLSCQALEQACIGLLYTRVGLRLDQCNLHFLFTLCDMISPDLRACFSANEGPDTAQLFKKLSDTLNTLRYRKEYHIDRLALDDLLPRCRRFFELANKLCLEEFARLEKMIPQKEVRSDHAAGNHITTGRHIEEIEITS